MRIYPDIMLSSSPSSHRQRIEILRLENAANRMTIGNAGQQSKLFLTGVPCVQKLQIEIEIFTTRREHFSYKQLE
jgi:hypothetical protein